MIDKTADRSEADQQPSRERTVLSATEARQGEIILGRYGRWIWIAAFAVALVMLILGL